MRQHSRISMALIAAAGAGLAGCSVAREPVALIEPNYSYLRPAVVDSNTDQPRMVSSLALDDSAAPTRRQRGHSTARPTTP